LEAGLNFINYEVVYRRVWNRVFRIQLPPAKSVSFHLVLKLFELLSATELEMFPDQMK
jgi:hypothetical protein